MRGIVEKAIVALECLGMTNEDAVLLLAVQAVVRMQDTAEIRRLLEAIDEGR